MQTLKKTRQQSANKTVGRSQTLGDQLGEEGVKKLFADLDVTYERLGIQPRRADLSPQRQTQFDAKFQELNQRLEDSMQLTEQWKIVKHNLVGQHLERTQLHTNEVKR